ncbi:MAG: mechanosensitive ion channel family protein [Pseudanabaena sp. SU_2_4]|nr:mechanosensitive ion channel family protein [Pseudanabaena sp. SU_2_4]
MDTSKLIELGINVGGKLILGVILWVVGRWLIDFAIRLASRGMKLRGVDSTIISYVGSTITIMLNIVLVVSILGFFGIETTSFAALLAAAGFAIGAAWSGLLANFAAGAFLIVLHPFKVGDFISGGGTVGTVREIGLFVTKIDTLDNVLTIVGNNKLFSDNIQNFSANPYRRVDLVAQLNHSVNHEEAIRLLQERIAAIPNVLAEPAPVLEILEFNLAGPVLAVRPFCNNQHYWQVYFNTNEVIREAFGTAGFPAPEQHYVVRRPAEAA